MLSSIKAITAAGFCAISVASASAAELGPRWAGLYVGAHAGWATSGIDWTYLTPVGDLGGPLGSTFGTDREGWLLGGQVGYQLQFNRLVAGVELSLSNGQFFGQETLIGFVSDPNEYLTTELGSLFLATGRLGYLVDPNLLVYVKGGYATASVSTFTYSPTGYAGNWARASTGERHHGWTIGAGLERALAGNITIGVEYNYIDLGSERHSTYSLAWDAYRIPYDLRVKPDEVHAVSLRLNLQLGSF